MLSGAAIVECAKGYEPCAYDTHKRWLPGYVSRGRRREFQQGSQNPRLTAIRSQECRMKPGFSAFADACRKGEFAPRPIARFPDRLAAPACTETPCGGLAPRLTARHTRTHRTEVSMFNMLLEGSRVTAVIGVGVGMDSSEAKSCDCRSSSTGASAERCFARPPSGSGRERRRRPVGSQETQLALRGEGRKGRGLALPLAGRPENR